MNRKQPDSFGINPSHAEREGLRCCDCGSIHPTLACSVLFRVVFRSCVMLRSYPISCVTNPLFP
jgi:hypothetical protein